MLHYKAQRFTKVRLVVGVSKSGFCNTLLYPDSKLVNKQMFRIIGKLPTIAACAYRHRVGNNSFFDFDDILKQSEFLISITNAAK
jgi:citrate synthase